MTRAIVVASFSHNPEEVPNGYAYITAMLNDPASRGDLSIARTVEMVRELASNRDFHEPWD